MSETQLAMVTLRPEGEGPGEVTRLEVTKISYGFGSGGYGGHASINFRNAEGNIVFEVTMPESLLDPDVVQAIYAQVTNGRHT